MRETREFELDGSSYRWDGRRWWAANERTPPPRPVVRRLNLLRKAAVRTEDRSLEDATALLQRGIGARTTGDLPRAQRLLQQTLRLEPENLVAAAVLSSILRQRGKPKEALAIVDRVAESGDAPVLTTRAAALCDLKRWEEALREIQRALAMEKQQQGVASDEALAVYARIQAGAPALFE